MTTRKYISIYGHYVVSINNLTFHVYTLKSKKTKGRIESYFVLFWYGSSYGY